MKTFQRIPHRAGVAVIGVLTGLLSLPGTALRGAEPSAGAGAKKVDLRLTAIDPADYSDLLGDLQGNILEDHGREHASLIFLKFTGDRSAVVSWIKNFAAQDVTSASGQKKPGPFGAFYLSASGYGKLGISERKFPEDADFTFGMKNQQGLRRLGDPDPAQWEKPYQDDLDALILLADQDRAALAGRTAAVQQSLRAVAQVVTAEPVGNMRNKDGQEIEHFGFADSVSQPLFFKQQIENSRREKYDPSEPLKLVLVRDPNGKYSYSCGSYLAVRKLRQDVKLFQQELEKLATALKISPELAGAYVIGRFRDGTPVALSSVPQGLSPVPNDFTFSDDQDGVKCPFQAHIHKMNPRGFSVDRFERVHRIVRRSMMFGVGDDGQPRKDTDVGMMFMCFQANIGNQFAFQQEEWANSHAFPRTKTGPDPLIGQQSRVGSRSGQDQKVAGDETPSYPKEWGKPVKQPLDLARCVELRGGEYFFAPSLSFLQNLE